MKTKFDCIVIGGGFSGVAAAIAAGRAGSDVLLVEKSNALGGAATLNLVNPFMPNGTTIEKNGEREFFPLSQGLFTEIKERLEACNAIDRNGKVFHEEYLKLILNRMALEAGVTLLFNTVLTEVTRDGNTISSVRLVSKGMSLQFEADYFIDASGDANLAQLADLPSQLGRAKDGLSQPMTLCFRLGNVDLEAFRESRASINPLYQAFQAEGKITNPRENVLIFFHQVRDVLHFNSTRIVKRNPVDPFDVTQAEIEAREQVFELFDFLKEHIDGFQNADLLSTASEIGVRESRKIEGEYLLTEDDLVKCTRFEDSIALGNYDIDIHNPEGSGTSHYYFPAGEYYTIPYRIMIPRGMTNLLVTGRCVSATHEAQASIRILPIVACLGQAAGEAVALAQVDHRSVQAIDIKVLQERLQANGAVL